MFTGILFLDSYFDGGGLRPCPGGGPLGRVKPFFVMQLSIACMSGCPLESLPADDAQALSAASNSALSGMVVDVSEELLSANALPKARQQTIALRYNNLFMNPPN
ncbi:MAG: hypothetical protein WAW35_03500 [Sideroxyarcus sp.]